ncbi:MAG: tetratricopeptide repeat protein [Flavobacteriales bacterium]|jgi:tetratricopeptide (TPR) repeat protein|nr:tetratricopeptide repeat protein [Flavobacteriales bacterium]
MNPLRTTLCTLATALLLAACGGARPAVTATGEAALAAPAKDRRAKSLKLYLEATQARLTGNGAKAIGLYEQCLKIDPANAAAHFELGKLYHQAQEMPSALDHARKAIDADAANIWYRFLLADLYQQAHQPKQAVEVYNGIIDRWPDRYEVYFDLANTLARTGRMDEAGRVFARMEERFGLNEEVIMQQFGMLAAAGRMEQAEELVQRAIGAHPQVAAYQALLGELYDRRGEKDKARAQYIKALELDPANSMLRLGLAEHLYANGLHEEAFDQLGLVFQDPEMDLDAKMQVLIGFFEMSGHEGLDPADRPTLVRRSYGLIDILEKAHPESGKPHSIHGDFLLRDGDLEGAREQFLLALRHEKDRFPIWFQVMQLDLQLGDDEGLRQHSADAAELFPTLPEPHLFNGIALSRLGRHDEAVDALVTGRDLVVDNPPLLAQFWSSLGDTHNEAMRFDKSDAAFEKALGVMPDDPNTLNNYAYYLSVRNVQLDKAERMSKRSNELAPGQPSYLDTYAWVLFRAGKFIEAREWIEKALESGGRDQGLIVEHYGDILYQLGDDQGALEQWRRAKGLGGTTEALDRKIDQGTWVE